MSNAVKAVIGMAVSAIGGLITPINPAIGIALINIGNAMAIASVLSQAEAWLGPSAPKAPPLTGATLNYAGTLEPRRIIYGQLRVGGINCLPPLTSGANNDNLHQVLAFAGHPVDGFGDVYFNQTRIPTADIGTVSGAISDGAVGGSSGYENFAWIRRYDGSHTAADYILTYNFSAWDASHVGYEIAYAALTFKYDQKVFSGGLPQASFLVRGKRIYDPRKDSTNGGSGTHRYTDPTTWEYSTNPALCLRDYLTSALGLGEAQTRINDTLVAAAANICDQTCTVPIPVLTGLTNWTGGSTSVTGINTQFKSVLAANHYLKAPNGAMVQIDSVTDDTTLALKAAYAGTSASGQVVQYNTSSASTKTQPRYTCNTLLDCTAAFQANISTLAGAMMGHCLYSGGKWLMYAGAWTGSAFSLGADDLVGTVSVQAGTPRANLFNGVRGNFIDPQSNYQPVEFPPVLDAGYTADDGEVIYCETNFPACVDLFEAQRNAILLNRAGRNQWVITAQFGMSAFGVKVLETGTVTIPELGWNQQTVRCTGWRFTPQGMVELTLQEAYAADWTDPSLGDYVIKGVNTGPAAGRWVPYPPNGLTATSVPGGIVFKVSMPDQVIPGTTIQLSEYTANTPFSSSTVIAESNTDTFTIGKNDVVTRYYWVRAKGPNRQVSSVPYPNGNGVAGTAGEPSNAWVTVNAVVQNGAATKAPGGSSTWDAAVYTLQGHGSCHVSGKATYVGATARFAVGLIETPSASTTDRADMDYGWYNSPTPSWDIFENGSPIVSTGANSTADLVAVTYDAYSGYVTYYKNGVSKRTGYIGTGRTFYGFAAFFDPYAAVNFLAFGPTTNLAVVDTPQIGANAATDVQSVEIAGPTSYSNSGGAATLNAIATLTVKDPGLGNNFYLNVHNSLMVTTTATGAYANLIEVTNGSGTYGAGNGPYTSGSPPAGDNHLSHNASYLLDGGDGDVTVVFYLEIKGGTPKTVTMSNFIGFVEMIKK